MTLCHFSVKSCSLSGSRHKHLTLSYILAWHRTSGQKPLLGTLFSSLLFFFFLSALFWMIHFYIQHLTYFLISSSFFLVCLLLFRLLVVLSYMKIHQLLTREDGLCYVSLILGIPFPSYPFPYSSKLEKKKSLLSESSIRKDTWMDRPRCTACTGFFSFSSSLNPAHLSSC